jgi:hypothetical protein
MSMFFFDILWIPWGCSDLGYTFKLDDSADIKENRYYDFSL